jgi:tetratricopeptide (TPR) repeat protein
MRAQPEEQLLSRTFTGPVNRALPLQGKVARAVADSMRVRITPEVRARLARNLSINPAAQEAYLSGLYHLEYASYGPKLPSPQRTAELHLAIAKMEEAVALDSSWARAYAKLAFADHWLASSVPGEADEYYARAKAAALRAIELDDTESQAYASLAFVLFNHEHDWADAGRAIRRAVELDPNSHHWIYALYLMGAGRYDEAIEQYQMAAEQDPLSDLLKVQIAGAYACADRHQEAIDQVIQLQARAAPGGGRVVTPRLLEFLVDEYALIGAHSQAIELAQRLVATTDTLSSGPELVFALAMAGRQDQARSLLARIAAKSSGHFVPYPRIYVALGDTNRAIAAMRASADTSYTTATSIRCWTAYQLLRDDPRIQALVSTLDLPS